MPRRDLRGSNHHALRTRPATLADVAQLAGVSSTTASFVLNGRADAIPAATRQRVHEAARSLHYAKSALVTALQQGRSQSLGIYFDATRTLFPADPVMTRALAGISEAAHATHYHLVLYTGLPAVQAEPPVEAFLDRRVDGLIIIAPPVGSALLEKFAETHLPCAVLFSHRVPEGLAYLDVDNRQGARLAVEHLYELGHRRIAHFGGRLSSSNFCDRRESYRSTLAALGLSWDPDLEVEIEGDTDYRAELAALLALPDPPTALFCHHDSCAIEVMRAAAALDVKVPDHLSVVGFDDSILAASVTPPLTTIRQPFEEMGRRIGSALVDLIEGVPAADRRMVIPVERIIRGTTAPIRRRGAAERKH